MKPFFVLFLSFVLPLWGSTLDEEISSMIMVGFRGLEASDNPHLIEQLEAGYIGGLILFDYDVPSKTWGRNITSSAQLKELTNQLQQASTIPLFFAIDEEGGNVSRLNEKNGFPTTLSQEELGKGDPTYTFQQAKEIAQRLQEHGIHINFAPVVDGLKKGSFIAAKQRAFSSDPNLIIQHAQEVVTAHRQEGVVACIKHFPGLGSAIGDTHLGFVDNTSVWTEEECIPFQALIEEVNMVMVGHSWNTHLDDQWPASLSPWVITQLLRKEMGYAGVVITDDLQMGAIANQYAFETVIRQTIDAGVDILLFANQQVYDEEIGKKVHQTIRHFIDNGSLSPDRIHQSAQRILAMRGPVPQCY